MLGFSFFATGAGRSPALEFLNGLPAAQRAQIFADLQAYRLYTLKAPISCRAIKGHRPLFEIRTGGFRTYCVVHREVLWVVGAGKKQDQRRDIEAAAKRMKQILGGL